MPTEDSSCLAPASGHQASGSRHQESGIRCTTAFRVFHCVTQIGQYTLSVVEERLSVPATTLGQARPPVLTFLILVPVVMEVLEMEDDDEYGEDDGE